MTDHLMKLEAALDVRAEMGAFSKLKKSVWFALSEEYGPDNLRRLKTTWKLCKKLGLELGRLNGQPQVDRGVL